ncbi:MAG: TetR/AcrR family transcriptional regulator [Saprospiraceae bacterium]|nr:TetR/AcrR family transcriptional regulator [Saprospiraceae bacterium]
MPTVKTSREEVLEKATRMIRQRGYAYTSMKLLAEECDIQPSHFYYYFKDKEDLMMAIIENVLNRFQTHIAIVAEDTALEPVEKIDKLLKKMAKSFFYTEGGCLMGNTVLETVYWQPRFLGLLQQFFREFIDALKRIYQAKFTEKYALELAEQVVQDLEGGIMLSLLYKDDSYIIKAFLRAKKHLL